MKKLHFQACKFSEKRESVSLSGCVIWLLQDFHRACSGSGNAATAGANFQVSGLNIRSIWRS